MSTWSFSSSHLFHKCQRQWYFKSHIASATAKDEARREAFLLSKLQTLYAWRGSVVDQVIVKCYVLRLARGASISRFEMTKYAKKIFDQQIKFARANRMREPGMKVTEAGDSFAALYNVEYGDGVADDDIQAAWYDIECALTNLLEFSDLHRQLLNASYLIAQRSLTFSHEGIKAKMTPDLVAFFDDQPPLIIDWKVHTFGSQDYRLQLALYALALINCEPHSDFPTAFHGYQATDVQLIEVQLLTKQQRHYHLTDEDMDAVSNYIARTALDMELAIDPFDGEVSIYDIPATNNPDECSRCPFRSLCWK